jgi:hypothetical protein
MRYNKSESFATEGCHDRQSKQGHEEDGGMLFRAFAVFCSRVLAVKLRVRRRSPLSRSNETRGSKVPFETW